MMPTTIATSLESLLNYWPTWPYRVRANNPRNYYQGPCPIGNHEHDPKDPAFSIAQDGQAFRCFKCDFKGGSHQMRRALTGPAVPPPPKTARPENQAAGRQADKPQLQGCTLRQLAQAKGLDIDFLRQLGWKDAAWYGTPSVAIPYWPDSINPRKLTRYRVGLNEGDRFRWEKGSSLKLYGSWLLDRAREEGYCIVVEGESDVAACLQHGVPALGIPGANNWHSAWTEYLAGIPTVYVWQEPGKAGETFVEKLTADLPEVYVITAPSKAKDPCELMKLTGEQFQSEMLGLMAQAERVAHPGEEVEDVANSPIRFKSARAISDTGPRPLLWKEAKEIFPDVRGIKPLTKSVVLRSKKDGRYKVVDFLLKSWRNAFNAQHQRQCRYWNMLPRLYSQEVFARHIPIDDWTPELHRALSRRLERALAKESAGGWAWFDNALG
ncbi:MAG TPA: hypothetical protein VFA32_03730, partial [Dehalococcoidia bacterium]|nr:hypothetical protein [Dehalococcoidia bacterium]